jgi:hypothetical protein
VKPGILLVPKTIEKWVFVFIVYKPNYLPSFDLMDTDLGRVLNILKDQDPDDSKHGFLPYMVTHSRGSVCSLLASSYGERINSTVSLILTKGNTLLAEEEINMCTVLRMCCA